MNSLDIEEDTITRQETMRNKRRGYAKTRAPDDVTEEDPSDGNTDVPIPQERRFRKPSMKKPIPPKKRNTQDPKKAPMGKESPEKGAKQANGISLVWLLLRIYVLIFLFFNWRWIVDDAKENWQRINNPMATSEPSTTPQVQQVSDPVRHSFEGSLVEEDDIDTESQSYKQAEKDQPSAMPSFDSEEAAEPEHSATDVEQEDHSQESGDDPDFISIPPEENEENGEAEFEFEFEETNTDNEHENDTEEEIQDTPFVTPSTESEKTDEHETIVKESLHVEVESHVFAEKKDIHASEQVLLEDTKGDNKLWKEDLSDEVDDTLTDETEPNDEERLISSIEDIEESGIEVSLSNENIEESGIEASLSNENIEESGIKASLSNENIEEAGIEASLGIEDIEEAGIEASLTTGESEDSEKLNGAHQNDTASEKVDESMQLEDNTKNEESTNAGESISDTMDEASEEEGGTETILYQVEDKITGSNLEEAEFENSPDSKDEKNAMNDVDEASVEEEQSLVGDQVSESSFAVDEEMEDGKADESGEEETSKESTYDQRFDENEKETEIDPNREFVMGSAANSVNGGNLSEVSSKDEETEYMMLGSSNIKDLDDETALKKVPNLPHTVLGPMIGHLLTRPFRRKRP
eukprot:CAMPEP_0118712276 /NCGR_PEP_ID=MMETSP0800-20121206/24681_1 /TAXON_ID=210618 ORGANISM="Striatella unipunctata, Strain CCMP2910" /NCGR_SAMPLE_ID=MMETSP0800 /ASSEMBLY_ACC=CAM_ASM_000638 /LENGTH=637 /DNA_ID=CAMNT_0006617219 /DNA_START=1 /DNA_END=1914 /DNA_ORIENTATION=-